MDNTGNPSSDEGNRTPSTPASQNSPNSGSKAKRGMEPQVLVALIGALGTFAIALLSFPPLVTWFEANPTSTFTPTPTSSPTVMITNTSAPVISDASTPVIMSSTTFTPTIITTTPSDTATIQPSPASLFIVNLIADKTTGRRPLIVKFDARDSILHEPNGAQLSCRMGPCNYTWRVYSGGLQLGKSENNTSGRFEYTFREKGTYTVTVYVCRGQDKIDCGGNGVLIVVT